MGIEDTQPSSSLRKMEGSINLVGGIKFKTLWGTQVSESNLGRDNLFNHALSKIAEDGFEKFKSRKKKSKGVDWNDEFYAWQSKSLGADTRVKSSKAFKKGSGWSALTRSTEFSQLKSHVEVKRKLSTLILTLILTPLTLGCV